MIWVLASVLSLAAVSGSLWFLILKRGKADKERILEEVRRQFAGMRMVACMPDACFHGLRKDWDAQWKGSGVLILTPDILYFRLWRRKVDLTIPMDRISEMEVSRHGDGLSYMRVSYKGMDDLARTATWALKNLPQSLELAGIRVVSRGVN